MRVPFKTETDAFRVAMALGLLVATAVLVGLVTSRAYGVVWFAAGIAAGATFELAGREGDRSTLREAAHAPHPHGATGDERHILVVASVPLSGHDLSEELSVAAGGARIRLDVLAPIHASRSHHLAGDLEQERAEAQARLQASLDWAVAHGFSASGQVGDADPLLAVEDELRDFGADEVVVAVHAEERASWLASRMLGYLQRELDLPVREIIVGSPED
jgi:hypothetical protein